MENWKTCPACRKKRETLRKELEAKYGRVTKEEYTNLQEKYERLMETNDSDATMRISYQYYWDEDANAVMNLYAKCDVCGSEWIIHSTCEPKENNENEEPISDSI